VQIVHLHEPRTDAKPYTFCLSAKKKELLAVFVTRCDSDSNFQPIHGLAASKRDLKQPFFDAAQLVYFQKT
jgi:hypothetical protein